LDKLLTQHDCKHISSWFTCTKAPTNSTFTDSNIPIHALTTIRLFAKQ